MLEMIYDPKYVGKSISNKKGKSSIIRKYHLTEYELKICRERWLEDIYTKHEFMSKSGKHFFNPYRRGIYYYQVQSLFMLGANQWHSLSDIIAKLEEYMSGIVLKKTSSKRYGCNTAWDQFKGKKSRESSVMSKDYIGRVQENFVMLQRLSCFHPYGYKLHQVFAAIDIKRETKEGLENGEFSYRLSTYPKMLDAFPIKDYSSYKFTSHEYKYVSNKFIGTIITMDKMIKNMDKSHTKQSV